MFSKACEYGIRAVVHLAQRSGEGERSSLKQVAAAIDSPVAFTAKILQMLARDGVIVSVQGPRGGYELPGEEQKKVSLVDIVLAIDGDQIFKGCALGLSRCDDKNPCPLHFQFVDIRDQLREMMDTTTVYDLAEQLKSGGASLKR
ncbi:MAG: Rrf2 family transcriptional regulator [Saprospiraceae bacterium]|nr:Rrf2 family transcriptional regulator [Saprospiraceae bacterium]